MGEKLRHIVLLFLFCAIVFISPTMAWSVSLEVGDSGQVQRPGLIPIPPNPEYGDCCPAQNALSCLQNVTVARPVRSGGLWVFPIVAGNCASGDFSTMDEALAKGRLIIREMDSASVNTLFASNRGGKYILMVAGEMITGGKQNRIIAADTLIPPGARDVVVPVFCGERGRWDVGRNKFSGKGLLAPSTLRQKVQDGAAQGEIWSGIAGRIQRENISTITEDMVQVYAQGNSAGQAEKCVAPMQHRFPSRTIGMVIFANRRFAGIEIFANPTLFRALHQKLLVSYFMDHFPQGCKSRSSFGSAPDQRQAREILDSMASSDFRPQPTNGAGCLYRFNQGGFTGQCLLLNCGMVHLSAVGGYLRTPERIYK